LRILLAYYSYWPHHHCLLCSHLFFSHYFRRFIAYYYQFHSLRCCPLPYHLRDIYQAIESGFSCLLDPLFPPLPRLILCQAQAEQTHILPRHLSALFHRFQYALVISRLSYPNPVLAFSSPLIPLCSLHSRDHAPSPLQLCHNPLADPTFVFHDQPLTGFLLFSTHYERSRLLPRRHVEPLSHFRFSLQCFHFCPICYLFYPIALFFKCISGQLHSPSLSFPPLLPLDLYSI